MPFKLSTTILKAILNKAEFISSYLLPSNCHLCGASQQQILCEPCVEHYFVHGNQTHANRCNVCAIPLNNNDKICGICLHEPPPFSRTIVACDYLPPIDHLVLALKFGHELALVPALSAILGQAILRVQSQQNVPALPDLLLPVPLSKSRLRQRGFNQALEIAKPLAQQLNLPLAPYLLHRLRDTTPQTEIDSDTRERNLRGVFTLQSLDDYENNSPLEERNLAKIRGRHIGICDDVMTTGATLYEVARTLKKLGATQVTNFVFARTPV